MSVIEINFYNYKLILNLKRKMLEKQPPRISKKQNQKKNAQISNTNRLMSHYTTKYV